MLGLLAAMRIILATIFLCSVVWARPQLGHIPGYDPDYPEEVPGLFEGDVDNDPEDIATLRNSMRDHRSLWPNGIVYYEIGAPHTSHPSRVQLFKDAMQYITDKTMVNGKTCVQFKPRTSQTAYIRFVEGTGCHTNIGYAGKEKDLTLSDGCYSKGRVMHELLHTLGFWHEQSRYDRDNYVRIHMDNVQSAHQHNFLKHDESEMDLLNEPYDYDSVMHYSAHSFAIDRNKVTIEVLQPGVTIGQRTHLSDIDIEEIKIRYGCIPRKTAVPSGSQTGPTHAPDVHVTEHTGAPGTFPSNPAATCTFEDGLCGWTQSTSDSLDWTRFHGKTPSHYTGPDFDHTSLDVAGNYLYLEASSHSDSTAQLISPLNSSGHYCFSAYYHMYGTDTGTLSFKVLQHGHSHTLKSFRGNLGNHWNHVRMEINIHHHFQIVVEGHTGHGSKSDIGIDDLSLTPGHC